MVRQGFGPAVALTTAGNRYTCLTVLYMKSYKHDGLSPEFGTAD